MDLKPLQRGAARSLHLRLEVGNPGSRRVRIFRNNGCQGAAIDERALALRLEGIVHCSLTTVL